MFKKILYTLFMAAIVLLVAYFMGPKPTPPNLEASPTINLPSDLTKLEANINFNEKQVKGIKPDNEARIVWADTTQKVKTKLAIVYIHGFSASQEEGNPVHRNLAKRYHANMYLARLAGHGVDLGDSTLAHVNANDWITSAEEALAIGKTIGNEVVIVATSFGGALTTYLASKHPEIKAIVLYSPCIKLFDPNGELLDNPWGYQLGKAIVGAEARDVPVQSKRQPAYWTMHYHLNGVVELQNMLTTAMVPETFAKITCPTLLCYYYKNETEQDQVVSVPAMLKMYDELGSKVKEKIAFSTVRNHVLASPILSKDVVNVQLATEKFLDKVLL